MINKDIRALYLPAAVLTLVALVPVVAAAQHRHSVILDWGEFQSIEKLPAEFGQVIVGIGSITLRRQGSAIIHDRSGTLEAGGVTDLEIENARIVRRSLTFSTLVRDGIYYRFSGTFNKNYAIDEHGGPRGMILSGTLTRNERGKTPTKTTVSFIFQPYSD